MRTFAANLIAASLGEAVARIVFMKINIVGGGPAGLYFGILMKKLDPENEISIFERDDSDDTYGWGIVLGLRLYRRPD